MLSIKKFKKIAGKLNFTKTLKLIWSISPLLTSLSLVVIFIENVSFLSAAYIFKNIINEISHVTASAQRTYNVERYLIEAFAMILLYVCTKSLSTYIGDLQGTKVNEIIDGKIHESAVELDLAFYESSDYFDTLKRAREAGSDKPVNIVNTVVELVKNVVMLAAISYVVITVSWISIPILVIFLIPSLFVRIIMARKLHDRRLAQTATERHAAYISSLIIGDTTAKEIRSYGLGKYLKDRYLTIRLKLFADKQLIMRQGSINTLLSDLFGTSGFFACIAYVCYQAAIMKISVGDITLFLITFPQLFNNLQNISNGVNKLYQDNIFLTHLFKLFDLKPLLIEHETPVPLPDTDDLILEVQNLSFSYPNSSSQVLTNVNLAIPAGKLVAVVGLNGAGKTTLIKLLSRLYDPTSGFVKLGGTDVRKFNSEAYRKSISIVFQDFVRYNVSVADNIRYGDIYGERTQEEIRSAAKMSGADGYIDNFPAKYETMMGKIFENGVEISTGQWQKMAIARSLYSPSKFVILDEATSAVDAKAEMEFFDSLKTTLGKRGALVISHRLSAVQHADYIYVMADGKIQQAGTHHELIAVQGDYATLFNNGKNIAEPAKVI